MNEIFFSISLIEKDAGRHFAPGGVIEPCAGHPRPIRSTHITQEYYCIFIEVFKQRASSNRRLKHDRSSENVRRRLKRRDLVRKVSLK